MSYKEFPCEKIRAGEYKYRGWIVSCVGYYPPDHCVVWEAYDPETGCADFHAFSKKAIKKLIDDDILKMEKTKMKKETTALEEMEKRFAEGWHNVISKIKVEKTGDAFYFMGWKIYPEMPEGYFEDTHNGSPLSHTVFIINGSPLKGGKRALLYIQ